MAWMLRFRRGAFCWAAAIMIWPIMIWLIMAWSTMVWPTAMLAQDAAPALPSTPAFGGPQDWSNRHVIFTRNGSPDQMWQLRDDPRFLSSTLLRYIKQQNAQGDRTTSNGLNFGSTPDSASSGAGQLELFGPNRPLPIVPARPAKSKNSKVDWAVSLGPSAGMAVGETPAIYTANYSSPSCANDFAVYTINATPSSTQGNLVALNNLYSTGAGTGFCAVTAPTFMFSYDIGSGPSQLSPVLSMDGTRVAWIENRGGTNAYLHVTIWVSGQGGAATAAVVPSGTFSNGVCTPTGSACDFALNYTASTYPGCTTAYPAINSHSDIYVDYPSNTAFVSANNGLLYHVKNIFSTTTNPSVDFCIPVNTTFEGTPTGVMSGPLYDSVLREVFVSDSESIYGYTVNASGSSPNFSLVNSYAFGNSLSDYGNPVGPGPLIDVTNGFLYLFSTYDTDGHTSVTQIPVSLASAKASVASLGQQYNNGVNTFLFYGAFDNNYFTYGPAYGTHAASTLYTCGADLNHDNFQDLFALSFNSSTGVMNTTPAMANNTNINPSGTIGVCSPLTEFYDGNNDRLFVGMGEPGSSAGSNAVTMWNIGTQLTSATKAPTATTYPASSYPGGTSGMAADNNANGTAQAESVYFSTEYVGSGPTLIAQSGFNVNGIYTDGYYFYPGGGFDNDGNAYSSNQLGTTITWNGTTFNLGPANSPDAWANTTITLPAGNYSTLTILAAAVNVTNTGTSGTFTINYTSGTPTSITQSVSDWFVPKGFTGESIAAVTTYRDTSTGGRDSSGDFDVYGYSFAINPNLTTKSLTLPATRNIVVLAGALSTDCGGKNYCAVKLTQSGLQ